MSEANGKNNARGRWTETTAARPCAVCGKAGWCGVSADGAWAKCMRVAAGAYKTKTDKNGAEYYLHRLDGAAPPPPAPPPPAFGPAPDRADADTLHRVYSALLARLQLSEAHLDNLRGRGLTDDEIGRRGYKSLPVHGRAALARALREQFGDSVLSIPGFIVKTGAGAKPYVTLAGAAGMLVPVRDAVGHVVALLSRRDEAAVSGKYSYLSSVKCGGPGPGAPVHVPLGVAAPAEIVRVTEGALKSDLALALSGLPTIGLPGVAAWRPALPMLRELGARTVRLAYDMDAQDKPAVARPLAALAEALAAAGFAVELERWEMADGKGIDDLLAAGKTPEVLTGDAARQAIAEIVVEGTAGEPPTEPGPLNRLGDLLADGGAEAFFRDAELLAALAALAEGNPAEFACRRAQLDRAGVKLRDFDKALAPLRQEIRRERPPRDSANEYRVVAGRIVRDVLTFSGPVETPLCNFTARIVEQVEHDDGAERKITLAVEGALQDGTPLRRADVPADQFALMRWPLPAWGTRAIVMAGASTADHLRAALQLLSGDAPRRTVYAHTGWRKIGEEWFYLHGGGAIGKDGAARDIAVSLPGPLAGYVLPDPPAGADLAAAIRVSVALLCGLAPDRVAFPLLAAVWRAALGEAPGPIDLYLHLAGLHAVGKSELAALCQQHFGPTMDRLHLPGGWSSTANAMERLAFAAKDALLTVDDYAPRGAPGDKQRLERDADRLFRGQGNRQGRQRMRRDGSLDADRPPRGLILSTGEDTPSGQSLRGRGLILEVSPGDVVLAHLTPHQTNAAAGRLAAALAGFVCWLAPKYGELRERLPAERAALRDRAQTGTGSARTPGVVADLALGMERFLDFALTVGAIRAPEQVELSRRCWQALQEAAAAQARHIEAAEPCGYFLRLLAGVLASGRGHVAAPDGEAPDNAVRWGWRTVTAGSGDNARGEWRPQGHRLGWLDGEDLYLEPEATYAEAQALAREQGDGLPVQARTLWKRLDERGLLAGRDDTRQRYTVRRRLGGHDRREVLHFRPDTLSTCTRPSPPSPAPSDDEKPPENADVAGDGRGDGCGDGPDRPHNRPQESPTNPGRNGAGDGGDGQKQVERPPIAQNNSPSPHKRRRGEL